MANTNNNQKNVEERTAVQKVTGLKLSAYESGTVTYNGETKFREGGVSFSKAGKFIVKFSGLEALFIYQSLKANLDFIDSHIAEAERKQLSSLSSEV